jgi:hypothetical protein
VRGGKVARLVAYFNRDRAFADLGVEEQADSAKLDVVRWLTIGQAGT